MKAYKLILFLFCSIALLGSCKNKKQKQLKTTAISFTKEGTLHFYKGTKDSIVKTIDIEIAESAYETQTGLMYRKGMSTQEGMLFIFSDISVHSFYMKNTQFPLDIIYLDEHLKIASFKENAIPFDETGLSSEVPVKYVLELNAGLAEKWNLEIGDQISYTNLQK